MSIVIGRDLQILTRTSLPYSDTGIESHVYSGYDFKDHILEAEKISCPNFVMIGDTYGDLWSSGQTILGKHNNPFPISGVIADSEVSRMEDSSHSGNIRSFYRSFQPSNEMIAIPYQSVNNAMEPANSYVKITRLAPSSFYKDSSQHRHSDITADGTMVQPGNDPNEKIETPFTSKGYLHIEMSSGYHYSYTNEEIVIVPSSSFGVEINPVEKRQNYCILNHAELIALANISYTSHPLIYDCLISMTYGALQFFPLNFFAYKHNYNADVRIRRLLNDGGGTSINSTLTVRNNQISNLNNETITASTQTNYPHWWYLPFASEDEYHAAKCLLSAWDEDLLSLYTDDPNR